MQEVRSPDLTAMSLRGWRAVKGKESSEDQKFNLRNDRNERKRP
jgi:hypothetical protein